MTSRPPSRPRLTLIEGAGPATGRAAAKPPNPASAALELAALGIGLTLVVTWLGRLPAWFHNLATFQALATLAFAFLALTLLGHRRYAAVPRAGLLVFGVALACRIALLAAEPSLSGDIHRYVWEGVVTAHGGDPYRQGPADPALAPLRDRVVWPRVNHPELAAIYPPLALAGFTLVAKVAPTVFAMKAWVLLHDLALVLVLLAIARRTRLPAVAVAAYAWNPLVLIEYAGSGHNEPVALLWLVLAFFWRERRPSLAAAALAFAALTKLLPLLAVPFFLARLPWRARAVLLALLIPGLAFYWLATRGEHSGLGAYWGSWSNNELAFHYLSRWSGSFASARTLALIAAAVVMVVLWWRRITPERATRWASRAALLLGPVLHPWYLGWELVHQPFALSWPWLLLSWTALLNYGFLATPAAGRDFHPPLTWRWIEYGVPLACWAVLALARRARRPTGRGFSDARIGNGAS